VVGKYTEEPRCGIIDLVNVEAKDRLILRKRAYAVYIIDRETDLPVIAKAEPAKRADLIGLRGQKWAFNWSDIYRGVEVVYKITLGGQLQGLVGLFEDTEKQAVYVVNAEVAPHNRGSQSKGYLVGPTLFALAAQCSFEWGQEGYVFLEAKTQLIPYYRTKLGARLTMPPKGMSIDTVTSTQLVQTYVKGAI
jgi:hypothetical protein